MLEQRDYSKSTVAEAVSGAGVEVGRLLGYEGDLGGVWIPGVELIPRTIYPQRHRGFFGELARRDEAVLGEIGLWPRQWAAATMFAGTCKGFHIHPPHIPDGENAEAYFKGLYGGSGSASSRPYDREQWDVMFFLQGVAEVFLVDERVGLERRKLRITIEGDSHRGPNNAAVVIPAGVAHAIRSEGSEDLVMVYGTSTVFDPLNEGRIAAGIEIAPWPAGWKDYWQMERGE